MALGINISLGLSSTASAGPVIPSLEVTAEADGIVSVTGTGLIDVTVTGSPYFTGPYTVDFDGLPQHVSDPVISGTVGVGEVQTANFLVLYDGVEPTPTFQWKDGGVNIAGATSQTYTTIGWEDLTVEVTAGTAVGTSAAVSIPGGSGAINNITADTSGVIIEYTGTLTMTGTSAGIELEAL